MKTTIVLASLTLALALAGSTYAHGSGGAPGTVGGNCKAGKSGKKAVYGGKTRVTVTAPAGHLISGYCVKAARLIRNVVLAQRKAQIGITGPGGFDISHYSVNYAPHS